MAFFVIGFLVLSLAELAVIVQVATAIGPLWTLVIMVLLSGIGAWVVKVQGPAAWRRVVVELAAGRMPATELIDGCLVLCSGILLLVPGFITSVVGLALAVPPIRHLAHRLAADVASRRIAQRVRTVRTDGGQGFSGAAFRWRMSTGAGAGTRFGEPFGDDIIDLDAEEVFIDSPVAELDPPRSDER